VTRGFPEDDLIGLLTAPQGRPARVDRKVPYASHGRDPVDAAPIRRKLAQSASGEQGQGHFETGVFHSRRVGYPVNPIPGSTK
jgi:hypothetical protein